MADGAVDTSYTIESLMVSCGIDMYPLWKMVAENNNLKRGGAVVNGKLQKRPDHPKPDIFGALKAQGWTP